MRTKLQAKSKPSTAKARQKKERVDVAKPADLKDQQITSYIILYTLRFSYMFQTINFICMCFVFFVPFALKPGGHRIVRTEPIKPTIRQHLIQHLLLGECLHARSWLYWSHWDRKLELMVSPSLLSCKWFWHALATFDLLIGPLMEDPCREDLFSASNPSPKTKKERRRTRSWEVLVKDRKSKKVIKNDRFEIYFQVRSSHLHLDGSNGEGPEDDAHDANRSAYKTPLPGQLKWLWEGFPSVHLLKWLSDTKTWVLCTAKKPLEIRASASGRKVSGYFPKSHTQPDSGQG